MTYLIDQVYIVFGPVSSDEDILLVCVDSHNKGKGLSTA